MQGDISDLEDNWVYAQGVEFQDLQIVLTALIAIYSLNSSRILLEILRRRVWRI